MSTSMNNKQGLSTSQQNRNIQNELKNLKYLRNNGNKLFSKLLMLINAFKSTKAANIFLI